MNWQNCLDVVLPLTFAASAGARWESTADTHSVDMRWQCPNATRVEAVIDPLRVFRAQLTYQIDAQDIKPRLASYQATLLPQSQVRTSCLNVC